MTDQIREQMSALLDGELPPGEVSLLLRRSSLVLLEKLSRRLRHETGDLDFVFLRNLLVIFLNVR